MRNLFFVLVLLSLALSSISSANPWTRRQGGSYTSVSLTHLATSNFYAPDSSRIPIRPYSQQTVDLYSEVGIVDRWLTATLGGTLYRRNGLKDQGATHGMGDVRFGLWSGLLQNPLHLAIGFTLGAPSGDAMPNAPDPTDIEAQGIARSLPTGDGEWDMEVNVSVGHSVLAGAFNLYGLAQLGYWLRTNSIADYFTYRVEGGVNLNKPIIDRVWLLIRMYGQEPFSSMSSASTTGFSGLGEGVKHTSIALELYTRLWQGLGFSFGVSGAPRASNLPSGIPLRFALSYEHK